MAAPKFLICVARTYQLKGIPHPVNGYLLRP